MERVLKMERGCVEDQPQHPNTPEFLELLRLVEDDTAALRVFKTRSKTPPRSKKKTCPHAKVAKAAKVKWAGGFLVPMFGLTTQ